MNTVLLAVDDTREAVEAARRAHVLFGPDATYLPVNVEIPSMSADGVGLRWGAVYPYHPALPYPVLPDEVATPGPAERAQLRARSVADEAGVPATNKGWWRRLLPSALAGDPATAILDAAESPRHDHVSGVRINMARSHVAGVPLHRETARVSVWPNRTVRGGLHSLRGSSGCE